MVRPWGEFAVLSWGERPRLAFTCKRFCSWTTLTSELFGGGYITLSHCCLRLSTFVLCQPNASEKLSESQGHYQSGWKVWFWLLHMTVPAHRASPAGIKMIVSCLSACPYLYKDACKGLGVCSWTTWLYFLSRTGWARSPPVRSAAAAPTSCSTSWPPPRTVNTRRVASRPPPERPCELHLNWAL